MNMPLVPDFVPEELARLDIELAPEQLDTLAHYLAMLLDTTQRINLTAIRDPEAAWRRLIIDSLTALPGLAELEPGGRIIDVGTGGGLPGVPLAIARPDLSVMLLDATGKKVRFLETIIAELGLDNAAAVQGRAETVGQDPDHREKYDVAVSR
ncbi:MAG: 16S rRNA (guanine(527)-N(7))-methyltransferase RsmG, partial [Phycisphaeraceae bacterium]